jgi:hypothetical protein
MKGFVIEVPEDLSYTKPEKLTQKLDRKLRVAYGNVNTFLENFRQGVEANRQRMCLALPKCQARFSHHCDL